MIPDQEFLTVDEVLSMIENAIREKKPFSFVRVGDGENMILAQDSVMPIHKVLEKSWVKAANEGKKGVTLPNIKFRDEMVHALKKADIVGIPFWNHDPIIALQELKRPLTEAVFNYFNIQPQRVCHTFVNRVLSQKKEFWNLLKGRRILIISEWAEQVSKILKKEPYLINVSYTLPFSHYDQMEETLQKVTAIKDEFDIALISCGVNAVVLSQLITERTEKVSIDFGKSLMFIVLNKAGLIYSSHQAHKNLLNYSYTSLDKGNGSVMVQNKNNDKDKKKNNSKK